jgi:hypothetical protein
MAYKPFPIYDLRQGKVTEVEPWLLPGDAFEILNDCHLRKGVLEKRKGYTSFGRIIHINTGTGAASYGTNAVMGIYNYYQSSVEQLIALDTKRVNRYISGSSVAKTITAFADAGGGEVTVTATAHGFATGDIITIAGTTSYNGVFNITKVDADNFKITDTWVSDDATGTATQEPFKDITTLKLRFKTGSSAIQASDVIVGASSAATATVDAVDIDSGTWAGSDANGTLHLSSQTGTFTAAENLNIQGGASGVAVNNEGGDSSDNEFTGDDTNFFWVENWRDYGYISNDNDQIQRYNSNNRVTRLNIDLDVEGGPDNDVNNCLLIFSFKGRLILLRTTERGTAHYQRARWCEINDPTTWKDDNWVDAPTEDWLMAADFIGDDLVVWFERSIWKLSYTADADLPFRWDKIVDTEGCYATYSLLTYADEITGIGPTRLIGTDGREAYGIDDRVPDLMLDWNQSALGYCYGLILEEEKQGWESYPSAGQSKPNKILVLNYDDNGWSTYDIAVHVLGYSSLESDLTWDDISETWDNSDWSWDDRTLQAGYPTTLMGDTSGLIFQLNDGGSDNGSAIEFEAISGRWNPYVIEGRQARLGWIDFLVDRDIGASFDVLLYLNSETSSYQTSTVTCTDTGTSRDKVWKRVYTGAIADFHRIEITNNAVANRPRIHAIIPYFKPAGRNV